MARAPADTITVEEWLDTRPIAPVQWLILIATSLVMFVDGFDLQALAFAIPTISRDWGVAPEILSWPLSLSLIGMGVGAALLGRVGDRLGRKGLICASLLLVGASSLIGFGVSGSQLVLIGAAAALYPENLRATNAGWATGIARAGAILAPLVGGAALSAGIAPGIILSSLAVPMLCQFLAILWARRSFVR